jgi:hypothetical protein
MPDFTKPDENPNIQVDITDASEFHCFRLTLNTRSEEQIEVMFHARSLVDLIHKCSLALCDWQAKQSEYLIQKLTEVHARAAKKGKR